MRSIDWGRALPLVAILAMALASAGCPELNRQPSKTTPPEFLYNPPGDSVRDFQMAACAAGPTDAQGEVLLAQGALSDQTRRAR